MSMSMLGRVSLEQAKSLVEYLETDQQEKADELIAKIQNPINSELFAEIGKLTRQLHDSLTNFQVDSRLNDLATADIPDAKERLNYVITRTEEAANKTMDAVESIFPVVDNIAEQVRAVNPAWAKLMNNEIDLKEALNSFLKSFQYFYFLLQSKKFDKVENSYYSLLYGYKQKGKFEDKRLFKMIARAIEDLKNNPDFGIKIPKKLWPKPYIQKHKVNNLWKYNLPDAWRLLYSIENQEIIVVSIILEWMKHKDYERKFKY